MASVLLLVQWEERNKTNDVVCLLIIRRWRNSGKPASPSLFLFINWNHCQFLSVARNTGRRLKKNIETLSKWWTITCEREECYWYCRWNNKTTPKLTRIIICNCKCAKQRRGWTKQAIFICFAKINIILNYVFFFAIIRIHFIHHHIAASWYFCVWYARVSVVLYVHVRDCLRNSMLE